MPSTPNGRKNGVKIDTTTGAGVNSLSPPTRPGTATSHKKSTTLDSFDDSPISPTIDDLGGTKTITKRACNECRQQKLRCDVQQDPYVSCTRCRKTGIECRIDANFRRVGKRKRNAEIERELEELRAKLAIHEAADGKPTKFKRRQSSDASTKKQDYTDDAITSLMDMRRGSAGMKEIRARKLGDVLLSGDQLAEIFDIFFKYYRPFQPLINNDRPPNWYYETCPLLFWTIVMIGARNYRPDPSLLSRLIEPYNTLLWQTVSSVSQEYYVVKSICLLCVWPLPVSSTSSDPTMMLVGLMMQTARQIGLHRPSQAQDFSKFKVELLEEELQDRVKTWAACNVIAQRVGTGYGQPALSNYDWTLANLNMPSSGTRPEGYKLPQEMSARLRIEQYVYQITDTLYNNPSDPVGLAPEQNKSSLVSVLAKGLDDLQQSFKDSSEMSDMNVLYIRAAAVHFRLTVFFDPPSSPNYDRNLHELWLATTSFVDHAANLKNDEGEDIIKYTTNYVQQMLTASGFALLKLLSSPFAQHVDFDYGKTLFVRVIEMMRTISVGSHDLPCRLAEVLLQLWKVGHNSRKSSGNSPSGADYSLQLKVRCRQSMSLIYDSVWRWREEFQNEGYEKLEAALDNPTAPDLSKDTKPSHYGQHLTPFGGPSANLGGLGAPSASTLDSTLAPAHFAASRSPSPAFMTSFSAEWENEVWDPISWTLDGHVGLPYPLMSNGTGLDFGSDLTGL